MTSDFVTSINKRGFGIVESVLDRHTVISLCTDLDRLEPGAGVRQREQVYGIRNLLEVIPTIRVLAGGEGVQSSVSERLAGCLSGAGHLLRQTGRGELEGPLAPGSHDPSAGSDRGSLLRACGR